MNKKDVLELKRRFKKEECTFNRLCGCYVDGTKEIVLDIEESFLNLRDEEFFKYLEIAKKVLSGTIGNNLLELDFPYEEENEDSTQYQLMKLKKSKLKDPDLLNDFYSSIINTYDYSGNFLILVFYDTYDVITKTNDNLKLDESEEVYEYILCAICPVSLTKPGLRYFENDNRIGARIRDWVVEMPTLGFLFPAFTDRSTDVNSIMYYTKNAKDPHPEVMEEALGCTSKRTATEQKEAFNNILSSAIGSDDKKDNKLFMEIQENLNNMVEEHNEINDKKDDPIVLSNDAISSILIESGVPEDVSAKIEKSYTEEFGTTPPKAEHLIDSKALAANEQRKKEEKLQKKVEMLERKLEETKEITPISLENNETTVDSNDDSHTTSTSQTYDIILNVKPEKVDQIKSEIIDGKKYIIIPLDENEQAKVNGIETII